MTKIFDVCQYCERLRTIHRNSLLYGTLQRPCSFVCATLQWYWTDIAEGISDLVILQNHEILRNFTFVPISRDTNNVSINVYMSANVARGSTF